jgi:hypothetical protein
MKFQFQRLARAFGATAVLTALAAGTALAATTTTAATTEPASSVTASKAVLNGVVDRAGNASTWHFAYGTTTAYGRTTPDQTLSAGTASVPVKAQLVGLTPDSVYHYRLVVTTGSGSGANTTYGNDQTFRTRSTGRLLLDQTLLQVTRGVIHVRFTCSSTLGCRAKFSVTFRARLAKTHRLATIVAATTKKFFTIRARASTTVTVRLRSAATALLRQAKNHRLVGKLTSNPVTGQHAVILHVILVLH